MKISSNTQFTFTEKEKNKTYELDLGNLKRGSDTLSKILFEQSQHLNVKKSCGCTMPSIEIQSTDSFLLNIQYDNQKTGTINQWVKEVAIDSETGSHSEIKIELKGTII